MSKPGAAKPILESGPFEKALIDYSNGLSERAEAIDVGLVVPESPGGLFIQEFSDKFAMPEETSWQGPIRLFEEKPAIGPHNPLFREEELLTGPMLFRDLRQQGAVAVGSFRGFYDGKKMNEDRVSVYLLPDGRMRMVAIDGVGGSKSGERGAEIARVVLDEQGLGPDFTLEQGLLMAHEAIAIDNRQRATPYDRGPSSLAVVAAVEETTDGNLQVHTVGDSEVVVFALPEGGGPLEFVYASTRPTARQMENWSLPLVEGGRLAVGYEYVLRLDPDRHFIDGAIGAFDETPVPTSDRVALPPGRKYIVLTLSDGATEQYVSHDDMRNALQTALPRGDGGINASGVRDALAGDVLFRSALSNLAGKNGEWVMEITPERAAEAYRMMSEQLHGERREPPADFRHGFEGLFITANDYVVTPDAVDFAAMQPKFDVNTLEGAQSGWIVGRVKVDNITVGAAVLER